MKTFLTALDALPLGTFRGKAKGKVYVISRSQIVGGRGDKLVAESLDGTDYISLNLYRLKAGPLLKPCEMPSAKVIAFVMSVVPCNQAEQPSHSTQ